MVGGWWLVVGWVLMGGCGWDAIKIRTTKHGLGKNKNHQTRFGECIQGFGVKWGTVGLAGEDRGGMNV